MGERRLGSEKCCDAAAHRERLSIELGVNASRSIDARVGSYNFRAFDRDCQRCVVYGFVIPPIGADGNPPPAKAGGGERTMP